MICNTWGGSGLAGSPMPAAASAGAVPGRGRRWCPPCSRPVPAPSPPHSRRSPPGAVRRPPLLPAPPRGAGAEPAGEDGGGGAVAARGARPLCVRRRAGKGSLGEGGRTAPRGCSATSCPPPRLCPGAVVPSEGGRGGSLRFRLPGLGKQRGAGTPRFSSPPAVSAAQPPQRCGLSSRHSFSCPAAGRCPGSHLSAGALWPR